MGCTGSKSTELIRVPTPLSVVSSKSPVPTREPTPLPTPSPEPSTPSEKSIEFSSEVLNFQVDDRKDQHIIDTKEDGYPEAVPPDTEGEDHKPVKNWFTDENFAIGSDEFVEVAVDDFIDLDVQSDTRSLATRDTNFTEKEWKRNPVLSFKDIDQHAKSAKVEMLQSFQSLLEYLKVGIQHTIYNETMIARAIITWLSNQDVDTTDYGRPGTSSPKELLQSLKERKMTYATCYAILCRKAGLKCVFIKGCVKAGNYETGDKELGSSPWTAVHADRSWQIVNPFWVCRALYGHTLGGWVKVESDGKSVVERERATKGIQKNTFQEYYFMPKPSEYIYECYTDQTEWQLLPANNIVRSKEEFIHMPYLLPPFFGLGLEMLSERMCELQSKDGICTIQFRGNDKNAHMVCLDYELFVKDTKDVDSVFLQGNKLPRLVFNSRSGSTFTFEIRFPAEGEYKLIIYGGVHQSSKLRLCEFKLHCRKRMQGFSLLPVDDNSIGWGPGPHSVAAGLMLPSKPNGLIPVPSPGKGQKIQCNFTLNKLLMNTREYSSILLSSDSDEDTTEYPKAVKYEVDGRTRQLKVQATVPGDGEYALLIRASNVSTDARQEHVSGKVVCNYLLSTKARKARLKTSQRLAKDRLVKALESEGDPNERPINIIDRIKESLAKCEKEGLDSSDEDIFAGKTRLEFLTAKNALRDCVLRRHLGITLRTLERIERYRNKDALHTEIQKVLKVKTELELEIRG